MCQFWADVDTKRLGFEVEIPLRLAMLILVATSVPLFGLSWFKFWW